MEPAASPPSSPSEAKQEALNSWRENNDCFYEYLYENHLDWPCTSCQWGPVVQTTEEYLRQKVYFSCRTGGVYNEADNTWKSTPNYIVVATVEVPNEEHYFINELRSLFNYEEAKKHPNLKLKHVIMHPGEVNVIRSFPSNRKILATKNDHNSVFIWTPEKHKQSTATNYPHTPDMILLTTPSTVPNFSLVFTPTLPRVMTASNNKIELFDLEGAPYRRELGSVLSSNVITPALTLDAGSHSTFKEKIEDIAFKERNNELCVTGGHSRRLGLWDLRLGSNTAFVEDVHQSDINCVSWKGSYILSGGSDRNVNVLDERKLKTPVYTFENRREVLSMHWNSESNHFAVGSDNLSVYSFDDIEAHGRFEPVFTHFGMRGPINDFDWNSDHPWNIISTCLELEPEVPATGGSLHIFRPLDLLYLPQDRALQKLRTGLGHLPAERRSQIEQAYE